MIEDNQPERGGGPWTAGVSLARIILENQGLTGLLLTAVLIFGMWFGTRTLDQNRAFQESQQQTNTLLRESSARQEAELRAIREQQATDHARVSEKIDVLLGRQSRAGSHGQPWRLCCLLRGVILG